jgi:hypothetical protein
MSKGTRTSRSTGSPRKRAPGDLCVETVEKVSLDKFGALCAKSDLVEWLTINDLQVGRGQMTHERG